MPTLQEIQAGQLEHLREIRDGLAVQLYTNEVEFGPDTALDDFVWCSFPGYSHASPADFGDPHNNPEGGSEMVTPLLTFTRTEDGTPQTIRGYAVVQNTPGGPLLKAAAKVDPKTLTNEGDKFSFFAKYVVFDIAHD